MRLEEDTDMNDLRPGIGASTAGWLVIVRELAGLY